MLGCPDHGRPIYAARDRGCPLPGNACHNLTCQSTSPFASNMPCKDRRYLVVSVFCVSARAALPLCYGDSPGQCCQQVAFSTWPTFLLPPCLLRAHCIRVNPFPTIIGTQPCQCALACGNPRSFIGRAQQYPSHHLWPRPTACDGNRHLPPVLNSLDKSVEAPTEFGDCVLKG